MCGIAGSFHPDTDAEDPWVEFALRQIEHRGPDARGVLTWTAATHGHVRLSILDLSERSNQPFVYGGALISYVGECWNYREIRKWLEDMEGREFRTDGDTEVVAALMDYCFREGKTPEAGLRLMDGQFALAVTESLSGRTWVARDRLGEVPLYVLEAEEGSTLSLFSEEPAGIRWASERRVFGERGAEATPVPPGTCWQLSDVPVPYWTVPSRIEQRACPPSEVVCLLEDAVKKRLQSDVPVAFLSSGGLDSSLILKLVRDRRPDVVAYAAAIPGVESPDLKAARRICAELDVELREVTVDPPNQTIHWEYETIRAIEIPMKAQVEIGWPCLALAAALRGDGYKVVLSGEGADELFGGYGNLMRKATDDRSWMHARRASVEKMARGNCVRTNKSFMRYGVEARLPFLDYRLIETVLPLRLDVCGPGKQLLKDAAREIGLPDWVIDQQKRTFQGASGVAALADDYFEGAQIKKYNQQARQLFGGLPRG